MRAKRSVAPLFLIPGDVDLDALAPLDNVRRIAIWREQYDALPLELKIGEGERAKPATAVVDADLYEWDSP